MRADRGKDVCIQKSIFSSNFTHNLTTFAIICTALPISSTNLTTIDAKSPGMNAQSVELSLFIANYLHLCIKVN